MDANLLKIGEQEEQLPETYIIFITRTDIWGRNRPVYHIERMNLQTGERFKDCAHIVYDNGAYRGNDAIGELMHDFSCANPDKMFYRVLAERTRKYKDYDEGGRQMGYIQEIREETMQATREKVALKLLKKGKTTLEEIEEYTELSIEEIHQLAETLKETIA